MSRLVLLLSFLVIGITGQKTPADKYPKETTLRVNYYRKSCQGEGTYNCFLVQWDKQIGTDYWELFYDEIKGFQYEPGFVYKLKIRIEKISNPPQDGSDRRYSLLKVLSKEKVK